MQESLAVMPRRARALFLVVALVLATIALVPQSSAGALPTCDKTWTGAIDDDYTTAGNWSPSGVPTATQYACAGINDYILFESDTVRAVRGINFPGGLEIVDGELRIGSTTNGFDDSVVGELVVSGGRRGGRSPLTVTDLLTMYDGRLGSPNTVTAARGGTTTVGPLGQLSIEGGLPLDGQHTVRIEGSATWSLGDITLCDGSLLQNLGTMELPSNGASTADCGSGANRFVNEPAATLVKLATGVDDSITVPFENQGTVEVNGASLAIGAAPVSSLGDTGTWETFASAIVRFDADRTFLSTSPVSGDGGMQTNGGTQTLAPGTTIGSLLHGGTIEGSATLGQFFFWTGGTFNGAGTLTLAPGSTSSGAGTLTNGYTLVNQGNWSIADDELLVCDGSTLRNEGALTISSNATSIGDCGAGPNLFHNTSTGTVTKASGIESYIDVPFTNDGTLSVSAGRLLLRPRRPHQPHRHHPHGWHLRPPRLPARERRGRRCHHQRGRPAAVGLGSALLERLGWQRLGIAHHQRRRWPHRVAQRHPDGGGPLVHEPR